MATYIYILAEKWVLGEIDRQKMMIIDHCSGKKHKNNTNNADAKLIDVLKYQKRSGLTNTWMQPPQLLQGVALELADAADTSQRVEEVVEAGTDVSHSRNMPKSLLSDSAEI